MKFEERYFSNLNQLTDYIKLHRPAIYVSSQTSTVIRFREYFERKQSFDLVHLTNLPKKMNLDQNFVTIEGPVTWEELDTFLTGEGKSIKSFPTEKSACVLAGVATSANGERSFAYGGVRDHIISLKYVNYMGEIQTLDHSVPIEQAIDISTADELILKKYKLICRNYRSFKNGPFPLLECSTDLMTQTEGQLGVLVEGTFEVVESEPVKHFFIELDSWREDFSTHLMVFNLIQNEKRKETILASELIDSESIRFAHLDSLNSQKDYIFFEVKESFFDRFVSMFESLGEYYVNRLYEIGQDKYRDLRLKVPRNISEYLSRRSLTKKGTDIQVSSDNFIKLLEQYQRLTRKFDAILFGHFGDAHLHFNFIVDQNNAEIDFELNFLYEFTREIKGAPFAEHGIGIIKKEYIESFLTPDQKSVFKMLKEKMDPYRQFFPDGFLSS